jgi:hypothetical protein
VRRSKARRYVRKRGGEDSRGRDTEEREEVNHPSRIRETR